MDGHLYLIALGSNVRHHRHGRPRQVLRAAITALGRKGFEVEAISRVIETPPLGHSRRRYANAAALVRTGREPDEVLCELARIEHGFGRRAGGQPWGARVLDLDIVLWSDGPWTSESLVVPHPAFRSRTFVLGPASRIAGSWRDPLTGLTLNQLHTRLTKPRPAPR
ncbi:2-amino-4-hydroxy-6-hydroxymethyldihydropteridine diphosphokinase [Novosphingobium endophyticum]|uniref:2-amino-4-hydroxy-6-hydroxymethyldihydropteridine pyrophosphokinase n=1 Tax=Novosphingobium endophyticum TaxID=1955250 RepID=A0A916X3Y8_9SPHN|nr:2-amino-4-hydroxy-6-hydroxymethyldihydropteridine diphosphokinase [Novosphingobium endophyticum]GGB95802.1 2-amino-4-hydroxy-6-hydroxymethyldihydropteridine diphosphokinase [Novosphingobium endophyticum]